VRLSGIANVQFPLLLCIITVLVGVKKSIEESSACGPVESRAITMFLLTAGYNVRNGHCLPQLYLYVAWPLPNSVLVPDTT
jgi:hypothetical protein